MSSAKKTPKAPEDIQAVIQALIIQGKKDGMIQASDLNAQLEKLDLTPEKIEAIYDSIVCETISPRYLLLDLYFNTFSSVELAKFKAELKDDVNRLDFNMLSEQASIESIFN